MDANQQFQMTKKEMTMQANKYYSSGREYTCAELTERDEAMKPRIFYAGYHDKSLASEPVKSFRYSEGRATARAVARRERKSANKHH